MKFTDLLLADRVGEVIGKKNISGIYDLLAKHLYITSEEAKERFIINPNFIKSNMTIVGDSEDIFKLVMELRRFNTKAESIDPDIVRIDLSEFINKIL